MTVAALATGIVAISGGLPASAAPKPSAGQLRKELAALQKEADRLIGDYNAKRVELRDAQRAEASARDRRERAEAEYEQARDHTGTMAVMSYEFPDMGMTLFSPSDLDAMLGQAAITEHITQESATRLAQFGKVRDEFTRAAVTAAGLTKKLRATTEDLADRREEAEDLIEKIKDKIDRLQTPDSRRADGTWIPQLPSGADNITPRMRLVRDQIAARFKLAYPVGCYSQRAGGGEHPQGRACDFMLSSGGRMPSPDQAKLGDEIAAWAIKNARRLGIMYVIYKQRIWHVQRPYWRPMSNRGGVTANHFDHPHISVY